MEKKIEQFFRDNSTNFDTDEPSDSVWDRIDFIQSEGVRRKNRRKHFLSRAAAILIIFTASYFFHLFFPIESISFGFKQEEEQIDNYYPELVKAEEYYTVQLDARLLEVRERVVYYPELEQQLDYDLSELDSVYSELKNDLKDGMSNEKVVDAMIQNYRLKLKILEDLLFQLKANDNDSIDTYENKEVSL